MGIYFVKSSEGPIKIGFSSQPWSRLACLQADNHARLSLMAVMPGTMRGEKAVHIRFANLRIRGEWFRPSRALNKLMKEFAVARPVKVPKGMAIIDRYLANFSPQEIKAAMRAWK